MIKNTNFLTKTLVALSLGAILSGCGTGIKSTLITTKKDINPSAYNLLKNSSRWFIIDTNSPNYEKWKNEQFINKYGKNNISSLSIINDCYRDAIRGTFEGRRSHVALRKYNECVPETRRVGDSIVVNFNEDGMIGEIEVNPLSSQLVSDYYYENYKSKFLTLIESGDTAELTSYARLRWHSRYSVIGLKESNTFKLKEIRKSLDKYEISYTYPKVKSGLLSDADWYRAMQSKIAE